MFFIKNFYPLGHFFVRVPTFSIFSNYDGICTPFFITLYIPYIFLNFFSDNSLEFLLFYYNWIPQRTFL